MGSPHDKIDKAATEGNHERILRTKSTYEHGAYGTPPTFCRYVVLEVIFDPTLVDDTKASYFEHELGVSNMQYARQLPRNSIIARRVLDGKATAEPPVFLFPFYPPAVSFSCKPGEHVWVIYEDTSGKQADLGYWMCRIVEPGYVEDVNHTHPPRAGDPSFNPGTKDAFDGNTTAKHEFRNGRTQVDPDTGERFTVAETASIAGGDEGAYEKLLTETDGAKASQLEAVPRYRKRPGDVAFEGNNNTLIVLGRDRSGAAAKTKQDDAQGQVVDTFPDADVDAATDGVGSVDIVAGRGQTPRTAGKNVTNSLNKKELDKSPSNLVPDEGDPDMQNDRSRLLVAQKTLVDKNFQLDGLFESVADEGKGDGADVLKSDKIRLIARSDIEILVTTFTRDSNGNMVEVADKSKWAAVLINKNGEVVFKPAENGLIKMGGEDADLAVLCTRVVTSKDGGKVAATPIVSTMGGLTGGSDGVNGVFATKVLLK